MTNGPIQIDTSSRQRPPRKANWPLRILWIAAAVGVINVIFTGIKNRTQKPVPPARPTIEQKDEAQSEKRPDDESQLQWASPTSGRPITLEYVPPGTQAIVHLRPAELAANGEGEKALAVLGPWGTNQIEQIEHWTGLKLSDLETLLVALHREDDQWQCTLRVTLLEAWSADKLKRLSTEKAESQRAVFTPVAGQGRVLVSCPKSAFIERSNGGDKPAILARDVMRLLPLTDADRSATFLLPTKFLDTEGRELFLGGGEKIIAALNWLTLDNTGAVMVSFDLREQFFCELAVTLVQNAPAHRFANQFEKRLKAAPLQLAESLATNPPHPHGKEVEQRYPAMLAAMSDYTRVSHEKGIVRARCYLPSSAGHNLLLASRLRLKDNEVEIPKADNLSSADRLNQLTSLSFPKETLEKALEMLAANIQVPIQIAGRDLQLEGITKNQTFSLNLRDLPAREILLEVLRLANPDRAATGPADARQKLVYVVRGEEIIVTTRKAALERGENLPEVFRVKSP